MLNKLRPTFRKLLPTIVLLVLTVVAASTDWLSGTFHQSILETLKELGLKFLPIISNLLVGLLVLSIARLLYEPVAGGVEKALGKSNASNRGKVLVTRVVQIVYWGVAIFIAATLMAPDVLSKLFLGVTLFGAALTFALQGLMKEVISGALLQLMPKFEIGDYIEVVGLADGKGKVIDIQYLSTHIEATGSKGVVIIPNTKIWDSAVKKTDPPSPPPPAPSPIILPSGYDRKK